MSAIESTNHETWANRANNFAYSPHKQSINALRFSIGAWLISVKNFGKIDQKFQSPYSIIHKLLAECWHNNEAQTSNYVQSVESSGR